MFLHTIGSRKTVPPRRLRIVPFGLFHIFFSPNSFTRASSGVIVAHLTPTWWRRIASAASSVTLSSVRSRFSMPEVEVEELHVEVRQDQPLADEAPQDARHLVPVELDDGVQ